MVDMGELEHLVDQHEDTADYVGRRMRECNQKVLDLGLEKVLCIPEMYLVFYQQHLLEHGSYKKHLSSNNYDQFMQQRYDWIFNQVEQTIKAKQQMTWSD